MRILVGLAMSAVMAVAAVVAFSHRQTPPLAATRLPVDKTQFDSVVHSKAGLVIGGELGKLLYSGDNGKDWTPATVTPDRQALITQVVFAPDGLRGLAIGQEGWILRTTDGGVNWKEVAFDEKNGEPFMGAANLGDKVWMVVGAFGRALKSQDDGQTWQSVTMPAGVEDKHLNRIVGSANGQQWLIVGEGGLVLRSNDAGQDWAVEPAFYNGSFYDAIALPSGGWLVYGMRGNAFMQHGDGPWEKAEMPGPVSFFGHAVLPDGRILLVGQGSVVATSSDGGRHFSFSRAAGRATLTDIALDATGAGWISSDAGLQPYQVAEKTDAAGASAPPPPVKP